jgi:hypothetical protein
MLHALMNLILRLETYVTKRKEARALLSRSVSYLVTVLWFREIPIDFLFDG